MREEVEHWWKQALDDLDTAKANLRIKKYHIASLFSQQSVEKALKAIYIKKFRRLKKTHDIVFLADELDLPEKQLEACKILDPLYIHSRYPDATGELPSKLFEEEDAEEFIKLAEEVIKWMEKQL